MCGAAPSLQQQLRTVLYLHMKTDRPFISIAASYILWGLLPLYWQLFSKIGAVYLLSWRLIGTALFCLLLILYQKQWSTLRALAKNRKWITRTIAAAFTCLLNYAACTYAFISGKILDSSLGNFLCPLLTFFISAIIFREKTNLGQRLSMIIATIGVSISVIAYGDIPYIAMLIAIPFAFYSAIKRNMQKVPPIISIAAESFVTLPLALLVWIYFTPTHIALLSGQKLCLLLLCGVATATPLLLFSKGVKRVSFVTLGFLQYISPTLSMIIGLCMGEVLSLSRAITFLFVGIAAALFAFSTWKANTTNTH